MEAHEWKAARIRQDLPFLERQRARLRHKLMQALRELAQAGEQLASDASPYWQFIAKALEALEQTFEAVYPRAVDTAQFIVSQSVQFRHPQLPDFLRRWYRAEAERHLRNYTAREQEAIRRVVQRAYLQGQDAQQVSREVARRILSVAGWQAERIARTELMRFYNLAHYGVYQTLPSGVIAAYEYSVVLDDRTSHICRPLVGKRVAANELRHLPPLHPHCRTVLIPIFAHEQEEEGVPYTDPAELPIPPGWGNIEGLPLPQPARIARITPRESPSEWVGELMVVRELGGSSGAQLVQDSRGRLWVRKYGAHERQVIQEHLSHELYRAAGIDAPASKLYRDPSGRLFLIAEYVEGRRLSELGGEVLENAIQRLRAGFVMDALLENYDVVGLERDNILVRADGRVVRVDNGGTFSNRARGSPKSYDASLQSLWSLRGRPLLNGQVYESTATELFAPIDLQELLRQMHRVLERREAIERVLASFEQRLAEWSTAIRHEVRRDIGVLRQRLNLMAQLVEALDDLRADFVDAYVERWGQFYEALISDGAQVLGEVVAHYKSLINRGLSSRARNTNELLDVALAGRFEIAAALWDVYLGRRGVPVAVRENAREMIRAHAQSTMTELSFWMRQLAQRVLKRSAVELYEHDRFRWRRLEIDARTERIELLEQSFAALHAKCYAVLQQLCHDPPSPVFRRDGTIRVARVFSEDEASLGDEWELAHPQLAVQSTGSSPYNLFTALSHSFGEAVSRVGVARVPIRRILTSFAIDESLYPTESEYLLIGGCRWRRVYAKSASGAVAEQLRTLSFDDAWRVRREWMRLWDSADDAVLVERWRGALEPFLGNR